MSTTSLRFTYIGGPTALLELGGVRVMTDPTFDPAGSEYPTPVYVLTKLSGPALSAESIGPVDVVLISHDHHFDNFNHAGRRVLPSAGCVITTAAGAIRLGAGAVGLEPWQSHEVATKDGRTLRIMATPAQHGPPGGDRGPVIGFILAFTDEHQCLVYISGDTVWYEGVAEVSRRYDPALAVLFAGAARVREVGPDHLTMTALDAVTAARAFGNALIVPLHFEGWAHFSESRDDIAQAFDAAGLTDRLRFPPAGHAVDLLGS